ncbi:MAG: hypothetical protein HRT45_08720 [Bdellovibrionales bacterium]|nr:hypothetical protein [Bdellovibrionales bacterium]
MWADQHPVGVVLLETHDLRMKCHQQSSYFEDYPNRAINTLRDNHLNLAYVISNMVIDPSWRKSQTDVPMSEALVSLTVWMAKEERADAVLGFSRKERSVDMILDSHGAFPLAEGFRFNCDVVYQCIPVKDAPTFPKPELKTVCLQYLSQMKPHHDELVQPTFEGYSIPQ